MSRFINPFTDYGFKLIMGRNSDGEFLRDFLNELLRDTPGFEPVVEITYECSELTKERPEGRNVVYDILCTTEKGHKFIVEMQNGYQPHFIDRSDFYVSRSVYAQGVQGRWDFKLLPVYFIALMNFTMEELDRRLVVTASLRDDLTLKPISSKKRYIYIQLPLFDKTQEECKTGFDMWIYTLKNMTTMEAIPFAGMKPLFKRLEDVASYANLGDQARAAYEADLQVYNDMFNQLDYAEERGIAKGRAEGRADTLRASIASMKANGISSDDIIKFLNMTTDEIAEFLCK